MKNLRNPQIVAIICGLRQLQKYGYPYEVDTELSDEEIDSLCENMNFDVAIEGYITFTTIEEGYSVLMKEYSKSDVVGGEMIDHMINNRVFDSSIPKHVLDGAIKMFREWDNKEGGVEMQTLNIKDLAIALNAFRTIEGRKWKSKLRDAWATGNWGSHKHYVPLLQSFRNRGGIDLLDKIHWALAQDEIEKVLIAGGVK